MTNIEGAIYAPPKDGLPFLVVTFTNGDIRTEKAGTRSEARALLSQRTRRAAPERVEHAASAA